MFVINIPIRKTTPIIIINSVRRDVNSFLFILKFCVIIQVLLQKENTVGFQKSKDDS